MSEQEAPTVLAPKRGKTKTNTGKAPVSSSRPSNIQIKYLEAGVNQPGGKLPLFDEIGQSFSAKTIQSCIKKGWAEPWFHNPTKPDWLVCRLTDAGRELFN